jgi:hypothetical protein
VLNSPYPGRCVPDCVSVWMPLLKLLCILPFVVVSQPGQAQHFLTSISAEDSPRASPPQAPTPGAGLVSTSAPSASISGIVLDANGGALPGADVTLTSAKTGEERTSPSRANGDFSFTELPAGKFKLTITSPGMELFVLPVLVLGEGEQRELPQISMSIAGTTTEVRVSVTKTELAQEQVKAAEEQRVLGVLPNFCSSYLWNAAPLNSSQKFDPAFHSIADPVEFVATGIIAGAEEATNTFPGYGQGAEGYANRDGAACADDVLGRMIGSAILPSLIHQDPRYFYKGSGSVRSRAFYAISRALVTRGTTGARSRTTRVYSEALPRAAWQISTILEPIADWV